MAAHTYWRLLITQVTGNVTNVDIYEWRFYDSLGAEISRSGGTASASSSYFTGFEAPKAFDGNGGTKWISNATPSVGSPQWLQYQFASPVDVSYITLTAPNVADPGPQDFSLQFSDDGSTWTTLYSYYGAGWPTDGYLNTFNAANAAPASVGIYWRLSVTATASTSALQFSELLLKDASGVAIPTTRFAAASSSAYTGYGPALAFDSDTATYWDAAVLPSSGSPITVTYWFGSIQQVASYCITATSVYTDAPSAFTLDYSYDNVAWFTVDTQAGVVWGSVFEQSCFSLGATYPPTVFSRSAQRGNIDWDQVGIDARHGQTSGVLVQYSDGTHTAGNVPVFLGDGTLTDSGNAGGGGGSGITVNGTATVLVNGAASSFDDTVLVNGA